MSNDQLTRDQAKAIREQHDAQPAKRDETAREAETAHADRTASEEAADDGECQMTTAEAIVTVGVMAFGAFWLWLVLGRD